MLLLCDCLYVSFGVLYVFFFIFFFKQKTAYEMRISDWSSDVCSSDLLIDTEEQEGSFQNNQEVVVSGDGDEGYEEEQEVEETKIGRASCRERVCQYV